MGAPLLSTKLFVPQPRPGLVPRPRLLTLLNATLSSPFTLVSAPAGFGKTTILAQWLASLCPRLAASWIQLDEGDNDPARFWNYFVSALANLSTNDHEPAIVLQPQNYAPEAELTPILNALADKCEDFIVLLDDYHLIKTDKINAGLAFVIEHCPPKMHLVIATRVDPVLPLPHFRGRGWLVELNAEDLRFTDGEAQDLIKAHGVDLEDKSIQALNDRAEGWVVGLRMAAMALRGRNNIGAFVESFSGSNRYVMDYLLDEVLKQQDERTRDFLLKTSVLEKMRAPLCDAITGFSNGAETMTKLEHANLFLVALDETRTWYRYHHLFADLLRHELAETMGPETVNRLHGRASAWYERQGMVDDAINHALAATNWGDAHRLIKGTAADKIAKGFYFTFSNWIKSLPDDELFADIELCLQYGRALAISVQTKDAEQLLAHLERVAQDDRAMLGRVIALQASLAGTTGNVERVLQLSSRALSLLPESDYVYRGWASYEAGFVLFNRGDLDESEAMMTLSHEAGASAGDEYIAATSLNFLAGIEQVRGHLRAGLEMAERASDIAGLSPAASLGHCRVCIISYELNDLDTALKSAETIAQWSLFTGKAETQVLAYVYQARALLALGRAEDAEAAMQRADQYSPRAMPYFKALHAGARILFALRRHDPASVDKWARQFDNYAGFSPCQFVHVPAMVALQRGDNEFALTELASLYEAAMKKGAHGYAIELRVCQALAETDEERGLSLLSESISRAESEGFVRTFADYGYLIEPLLRRVVAKGSNHYAARLLRIVEHELALTESHVNSSPDEHLLSHRETEVLRLLRAGLTNQQDSVVQIDNGREHAVEVRTVQPVPGASRRETRMVPLSPFVCRTAEASA